MVDLQPLDSLYGCWNLMQWQVDHGPPPFDTGPRGMLFYSANGRFAAQIGPRLRARQRPGRRVGAREASRAVRVPYLSYAGAGFEFGFGHYVDRKSWSELFKNCRPP